MPDILDIYKKIGKEILDKETHKYIKYEKLFLLFNKIYDVSKKLNSNY